MESHENLPFQYCIHTIDCSVQSEQEPQDHCVSQWNLSDGAPFSQKPRYEGGSSTEVEAMCVATVWAREAGCCRQVAALCSGLISQVAPYYFSDVTTALNTASFVTCNCTACHSLEGCIRVSHYVGLGANSVVPCFCLFQCITTI